MPVTGQCKTNPVSGVSGDIYNSLTGDPDNGLAGTATTSGSTARKLLGALLQAIAAAIVNNLPATGDHTDGTAVAWAQGTGAGQISFGAAAPAGSLTSASGCDEGGQITFSAGGGTSTGVVFTVHFKTAFQNAPAICLFPANDAAAHLIFVAEMHATSSTTTFSFSTASGASPLSNTTYSFFWIAKGSK